MPSPAVSVCVGIFTLLRYRLVFPLGGGWGGGRVPGCVLRPLDQIVIADDCARRCLCVSVRGADRAPSLGGFNSKRTCEEGSVKSVCAGVEGGPWARSIKWLL